MKGNKDVPYEYQIVGILRRYGCLQDTLVKARDKVRELANELTSIRWQNKMLIAENIRLKNQNADLQKEVSVLQGLKLDKEMT